MDLLTKEQLDILIGYRNDVCVSIYMPAFRMSPETRQNQIRFKNLLREAGEKLGAKGFRPREVEDLLSAARPLINDDPFWSFQSEGFCAFVSRHDFLYYRLPLRFEETVTVLGRFYIKPLVTLFYSDNQFFILALGLNGARFYQCSRYSMNEAALKNVPKNLDEAMKYSDSQKQLQFHTHTPRTGTKRAAMFHGQGAGIDNKKTGILEYFKMVDRGVANMIGQERVPLLFAGLDHLFGIYKKANSYAFITEKNIPVNPDDLTEEQLHGKAVEIMGPYFLAARDEAIKTYKGLTHTGRTANDIETVVREAFGGRVEALFISAGEPRWGTFDPSTLTVDIHDDHREGDEDLLDLACVYTCLKGGAVYDVAAGEIPATRPPAAVFRY